MAIGPVSKNELKLAEELPKILENFKRSNWTGKAVSFFPFDNEFKKQFGQLEQAISAVIRKIQARQISLFLGEEWQKTACTDYQNASEALEQVRLIRDRGVYEYKKGFLVNIFYKIAYWFTGKVYVPINVTRCISSDLGSLNTSLHSVIVDLFSQNFPKEYQLHDHAITCSRRGNQIQLEYHDDESVRRVLVVSVVSKGLEAIVDKTTIQEQTWKSLINEVGKRVLLKQKSEETAHSVPVKGEGVEAPTVVEESPLEVRIINDSARLPFDRKWLGKTEAYFFQNKNGWAGSWSCLSFYGREGTSDRDCKIEIDGINFVVQLKDTNLIWRSLEDLEEKLKTRGKYLPWNEAREFAKQQEEKAGPIKEGLAERAVQYESLLKKTDFEKYASIIDSKRSVLRVIEFEDRYYCYCYMPGKKVEEVGFDYVSSPGNLTIGLETTEEVTDEWIKNAVAKQLKIADASVLLMAKDCDEIFEGERQFVDECADLCGEIDEKKIVSMLSRLGTHAERVYFPKIDKGVLLLLPFDEKGNKGVHIKGLLEKQVNKAVVGVEEFSSIAKAAKDLGYSPKELELVYNFVGSLPVHANYGASTLVQEGSWVIRNTAKKGWLSNDPVKYELSYRTEEGVQNKSLKFAIKDDRCVICFDDQQFDSLEGAVESLNLDMANIVK